MYNVRTVREMNETSNGKYEIYSNDDLMVTLEEGYAPAIVMKFYAIAAVDPKRAQDFMAGVIDGMIHVDMVRKAKENASLV